MSAQTDVQTELRFVEPRFISCGCCGCWHPIEFHGDCRDDSNRFYESDLDELYGPTGWEQVIDEPEWYEDDPDAPEF